MDWRKKAIFGLSLLCIGTLPVDILFKRDRSYIDDYNEYEKRSALVQLVKEIYPSATIEDILVEEEEDKRCPSSIIREGNMIYQNESVKVSIGRQIIGKYCVNGRTNLSALNADGLFFEDLSIMLLKYSASILEIGNLNKEKHEPYYNLGSLDDYI